MERLERGTELGDGVVVVMWLDVGWRASEETGRFVVLLYERDGLTY